MTYRSKSITPGSSVAYASPEPTPVTYLQAAIAAERAKVADALARGRELTAEADRLDAASLALLADIAVAYDALEVLQ